MPERIYISELDSAENQEQHQVIRQEEEAMTTRIQKANNSMVVVTLSII